MLQALSIKSLALRVLQEMAGRSLDSEKCPTQIIQVGQDAGQPASAPARPSSLPHAAIAAGAVLLAPRYDGAGKPLAAIPECWCCRNLYRLERLQECHGKTYAFLEPRCGCLDAGGCYACFACREHCRCSGSRDSL